MSHASMSISRAFGIAFGLGVLLEVAAAFGMLSWAPESVVFLAQYAVLVLLGFLLGRRRGRAYSVAVANTLPFVVLWFVFGYVRMNFLQHETPPNWTAEQDYQAWLGYIFANVLFLPLAFAASALGVLLARVTKRVTGSADSAA